MTTLVVGASGATGKLLVAQLLERGESVRVIVRNADKLPKDWQDNHRVKITQASLLDLSDGELAEQVKGCDAVASCLGHNISFKGLFGKPRRLVTDATRRLCEAIRANRPEKPVRFVLMNTTGNRNRDLDEKVSLGHRMVVGLLRLLLPPHVDNEQAAEHLRTSIGSEDGFVQWCAVRPDGLIDQEQVSPYELHLSPTRDPIFNAGKTSRINVGHFMAQLATDPETFSHWRGEMPVIYNKEVN